MAHHPNHVLTITSVTLIACLAVVTSRAAQGQSGDEFTFEPTGSLSGTYNAVAETGNDYLMLGGPGKMDVVDVSDPSAPSIVEAFAGVASSIQQATASPTPAPADLQIRWWYDYWFRGCLPPGQPMVVGLRVTNAGGTAAGPFVVQDGRALWRIPGIEPGDTYRWTEWGLYPRFPLVVDAYGQVVESNEDNNVVDPAIGPTWTRTPSVGESRATPRPPRRGAAVSEPMRPLTQPVPCPTRTRVPTLTPSGQPPLPDLQVVSATWDQLAVQMPDAGGLCIPLDEPWHFQVTIRNSGDAEAGWFSVAGGGAAWRVHGLGAGRSIALLSEPLFLPESITVDALDWVEESREDNNTWSLPPGGTPTPKTRALPYCDPTPTAPTRTPTATPTATVRATPTCPPGWEPPRLDITLEPDEAYPMQLVTAHLRGVSLGFSTAAIRLDMPGQGQVVLGWRSPSGGWTSSGELRFPAPDKPGNWSVSGYGSGERHDCVAGRIVYSYGGASTTNPITLTVSGSTLLMPIALSRANPAFIPTVTHTATATATATSTGTPTATRTPLPSFLGFDGYVWEGSASGPGLPDVEIVPWFEGTRVPSVTTNEFGFYTTPLYELQGQTWRVVPSSDGYYFDPPGASGKHRSIPNQMVERVSFVAHRGTPTPTGAP